MRQEKLDGLKQNVATKELYTVYSAGTTNKRVWCLQKRKDGYVEDTAAPRGGDDMAD